MTELVQAKLQRVSLTERLAGELRRRILDGRLAAGVALRQERLAAELGASRIPLREAIRQLEAEGLVASVPHKGTVVSRLSADELDELFAIRLQLETWLFGQAIPRLGPSDIAEAERLTDEAAATGSVANWGELNWRFHETLYRPSGSRIALKMLRTVHDNAARYVNLQLVAADGDVERELSDHHAMLAYARLGDVARGVDMLRRHITRVAPAFRASMAAGAATPLRNSA